MKRSIILALTAVLFMGAGLCFAASDPGSKDVTATANVSVGKDSDAIVAELFTSQGCSSCPPANAFLGDLAQRTDVVALELHVDYWDQLKTAFHGSWKDPYSSPIWSQRQADYDTHIMGGNSVYTPQLVIDGRLQEEGARRSAVNEAIEQAKALRRVHYKIAPRITPDGKTVVHVEGPGLLKPVQVILARTLKEAKTKVGGGENNGASMVDYNVVKDMIVVGTWDGGKEDYNVAGAPLLAGESCAALLQDPETLHILAGGACGL